MLINRIGACILALLIPGWGLAAAPSEQYPSKPVRLVVPFSPGGSTSLMARLLSQKLADSLGQPFIVDNRGGAGGSIGGKIVARADGDGYTLMVTNPGPSLNSILLRKKPSYGFADFAPVIYIGSVPLIVVANLKFPASNMKELVAFAKANPGKVNWGSSGTGSNPHAALEVLKAAMGLDIVHVPYKGSGPALTDVVSGQIQAVYTTTVTAKGFISNGRVKVLGVAGPNRQAVIPDVPTLAEQGISGADNIVWIGLVAPAKTPPSIIQRLNGEINRILRLSDVRSLFDRLGFEVQGGSPEEFANLIKKDADR
ncbi:MAG: tripartite tricarboxylate transporter substrate binding protein, partial [Gammaproteobacteria bacterium]|nr:tripartite tricarboxylate transporter substrate binding protein [Gammaproteobacteria bacterium]